MRAREIFLESSPYFDIRGEWQEFRRFYNEMAARYGKQHLALRGTFAIPAQHISKQISLS